MVKKESILYWSIELLVLALLIWVCTKIDFIFRPILISCYYFTFLILHAKANSETFDEIKSW